MRAENLITALYQAHALGLTRLAHVMLSDAGAACRSAIRRRRLRASKAIHEPAAASAESVALTGEEQRSVLVALRKLPARQREVLVLRFYLHESDDEIARVMGVRPSTVRSTSHRALAALGRMLGEGR